MLAPDLKSHYSQIWQDTKRKFQAAGVFDIDPLIDSPEDCRRGISLVIRPSQVIKQKMQAFMQDLQPLEPEQYYYPVSDLHVTVLSIISCYPGFTPESIPTKEYIALVQKSLKGVNSFAISYQGITASPSCVLAQGYPMDEALAQMRDQLRTTFKRSSLQQSIDARYAIQTAHTTLIRFRKPLQHPKAFLQKLENLRDYNFGISPITEVELVYNDWYLREQEVQVLARFPLSTQQ